jgi:hypothetical protein
MDVYTTRWTAWRTDDDSLPEPDDRATLVLAFAGTGVLDDPAQLRKLLDRYPSAIVAGCSTSGEIVDDTVSDGSIALAVIRFDATRVITASEPISSPDESFDVGRRLAVRLREQDPALAAVLVLSDGLHVNGSAVAAGLVDGTDGRVPIFGGLAGDEDRFDRTWVLVDREPRPSHVTAVGLAGDRLAVRHGSQGGWEEFGPVRQVTRSDGNVLFELDGEPALKLYKHYLGDRADGLPATALLFPLAVQMPGSTTRRTVVRTVLSVDPAAQSMTFAGDIPTGATAQLMTSGLDRLVAGASSAGAEARGEASASDAQGDVLAVAVSCVGRRLVLARHTEDELEAVLSQLAPGTRMVGFYSYGELAPVEAGSCDLHNQTMTVTTITELR